MVRKLVCWFGWHRLQSLGFASGRREVFKCCVCDYCYIEGNGYHSGQELTWEALKLKHPTFSGVRLEDWKS